MLEIRNITKIYRSKTGQEVRALDDVSITFPETGMVFILGKSGSGKSTLLNVIGGLDDCDAGQFVIKGKPSSGFVGSDFDAYRNTFIGFIFQEYNILDDFTVGANIALALELQGKKATNEQINSILSQVEMLDCAKRKPNELSGGQKQRVAIARALVKDPEIIMADEPTGALDSATGKQIFDTLKALSKKKLVIIVSHDRDFAELYGDRIIEMKDGKILSDVTKHEEDAVAISGGVLQMNDGILKIRAGYELTSDDLAAINTYLRKQNEDVFVSGDRRINDTVRTAAGITAEGKASTFKDTDENKDVPKKVYEKGKTKFIRSSLPMKNAIKMGANSLSHKRFRLVMTIFLSLIAFTLFGFASTVSTYNKFTAATDSILDGGIKNATMTLGVQEKWVYSDGDESIYYNKDFFNDEDIASLEAQTGIDFIPVYANSFYAEGINISNMLKESKDLSDTYYSYRISGYTVWNDALRDSFSYQGAVPAETEGEHQIIISKLLYEMFNYTGFENSVKNESVAAGQLTMDPAGSANSIIGKHITIRENGEITFKIVGVADTAFDYARYETFAPKKDNNQQGGGEEAGFLDMVLQAELENTLQYGFHNLFYVSEATMQYLQENSPYWRGSSMGTSMNGYQYVLSFEDAGESMGGKDGFIFIGGNNVYFHTVCDDSNLSSLGTVVYFDGRTNAALGEKEFLIPLSSLRNLGLINENGSVSREADLTNEFKAALATALGWDLTKVEELIEEYPQSTPQTYLWEGINRDFNEGLRDGNSDDHYQKARRDFLNTFLGRRYEENRPARFFELVSNALPSMNVYGEDSEQKYMVRFDNLRELLAVEYAYDTIKGKTDDFLVSDAFFENVVSQSYGGDIEAWKNESADWRKNESIARYRDLIAQSFYDGSDTVYGGIRLADIYHDASSLMETLTGVTDDEYLEAKLADLTLSARKNKGDGNEVEADLAEYTLAGYYKTAGELGIDVIVSKGLYNEYIAFAQEEGYGINHRAPHMPGEYPFVIAPMPQDRATVEKLVDLTYDQESPIIFEMQNNVMDTLENFNDFIEIGAIVFLWVGVGFAVFAALMLMSFISTSISYKKHEIGILRAVGARSSDVFKVFFSEAAMIALINFVLSLIATIAAVIIANAEMAKEGINVTLLHFGAVQVILMLAISLFVAAVASFLPVYNIARKKPIDAIRNK